MVIIYSNHMYMCTYIGYNRFLDRDIFV